MKIQVWRVNRESPGMWQIHYADSRTASVTISKPQAGAAIAGGIEAAIKIKLAEILTGIKTTVQIKN